MELKEGVLLGSDFNDSDEKEAVDEFDDEKLTPGVSPTTDDDGDDEGDDDEEEV